MQNVSEFCGSQNSLLLRLLSSVANDMLLSVRLRVQDESESLDPLLPYDVLKKWDARLVDFIGIDFLDYLLADAQRRTLLACIGALYARRGTLLGLKEFLQICLGLRSNQIKMEISGNKIDIVVSEPLGREKEYLARAIIEAEKPAHAAYMLKYPRSDGA